MQGARRSRKHENTKKGFFVSSRLRAFVFNVGFRILEVGQCRGKAITKTRKHVGFCILDVVGSCVFDVGSCSHYGRRRIGVSVLRPHETPKDVE